MLKIVLVVVGLWCAVVFLWLRFMGWYKQCQDEGEAIFENAHPTNTELLHPTDTTNADVMIAELPTQRQVDAIENVQERTYWQMILDMEH